MKWEYNVVVWRAPDNLSDAKFLSALDNAGNEGWELVAVAESPKKLTLFFKRPVA